jgi:putative SOS response-associated peptidase YedK
MCGRYGRRGDKQYIAEHYRVRDWEDSGLPYPYEFGANLDCRPGSIQPVVTLDNDGREMALMRWGFNLTIQGKKKTVFNTKSENVLESKLWKKRFAETRCIIPASSFYEWQKIDGKTGPKFEISVPGRDLIGFAGLWGNWTNPKTGEWEKTFSIFTTTPNDAMRPFHDRQPVILEPSEYEEWLTPSERPPVHLLRIFPEDQMAITKAADAPEPKAKKASKKPKPAEEPELPLMGSLFE